MSEYISTRCAVCQLSDGLVVNIIIATPSDLPPTDCQIIEVMTGQGCDIGWYWNGVDFIAPSNELT
jgi:hypothetical protein